MITFDYITKLPALADSVINIGYNSIFVIVNRFTKFFYFIPYIKDTDIEQLVYIFLKTIINVYKLPAKIILNKGITFTSKFW